MKGCRSRPEPWGWKWLNSRHTGSEDKIAKVAADRLNWGPGTQRGVKCGIRISGPNKQNYKSGQGLKVIHGTLNDKCNGFLKNMSFGIFS